MILPLKILWVKNDKSNACITITINDLLYFSPPSCSFDPYI